MPAAPLPADENERLASLRSYEILDTLPEQEYDDLCRLAAEICETPISLVSLVDENRQWFKARVGLDATETKRELAFCAHAILERDEVLVVPDATVDPRFIDNDLVTGGPKIRFYAGAPIIADDGHAFGTICVIDDKPHSPSLRQLTALRALSRQVTSLLELRRSLRELHDRERQLEATNTELESANQELDSFCHLVSHDLKEPVRGLRHLAEFLGEDHGETLGDDGKEQLTALIAQGTRIETMIDALLAYTRAGQTSVQPDEIPLEELLRETVASVRVFLEEKNAEVVLATPLPSFRGDRAAVAEVVRNLVVNAVKYNDNPRPRVEIGVDKTTGTAGRLYVKDNGIGIAPERIDDAFLLFRRLHGRSAYGGGTGSGLAIVKRIVERDGGAITVEALPAGGSIFRFHFRPEEARCNEPAEPNAESTTGHTRESDPSPSMISA